ncbi:MAG: uroporphyrinogen-III C-methyltransferase [Verrucomicrobiota bacterium]
MTPPSPTSGIVYLIGAGPGDPGLLTLRAAELIASADVVLYDYLVHPDILQHAPPTAELIYVGKKAKQHTLPQGGINELLVEKARAGRRVVRLKGGDPYVFGRGGEEAQELAAAGIAFEVVPGITSGIAGPAYAGIPVTHREFNTSVTFITAHEDPTKGESTLNWKALAAMAEHGTLVFYMGVERLRALTGMLSKEGADPKLPVSIIRWGTLGRQTSLHGDLSTIAEIAEKAGMKPPALTVVGRVNRLRETLNWFEHRPLFGRRIVVTRTREQASRLSRELRILGAEVLEIPTIRIEPAPPGARELDNLQNFSEFYDWLVFTSPNGVTHFFDLYFRHHPDIRKLGPVRIATVGPATATALAEYRLQSDLTPRTYTTEALGEAFRNHDLHGQRMCLARSQLANPQLSADLKNLGAHVEEWSVYQTVPENEDLLGKHQDYLENGADYVTFTSSSTVENWVRLDLKPPENRSPVHASIGPVTSETLRQLNLPVNFEAATHTIPGLIEAILQHATQPIP